MASLRRIVFSLTIAAAGFAGLSDATANTFPRCPKPADHAEVVKALTIATDRSRAMAEDNPLLLADVGFYVGVEAGQGRTQLGMENDDVVFLQGTLVDTSSDERDSTLGLYGGYQFAKYFAVESAARVQG